MPPQNIPIGSILPWVPKPNFSSGGSARFGDYPGWIKCDGIEVCTRGEFKEMFRKKIILLIQNIINCLLSANIKRDKLVRIWQTEH